MSRARNLGIALLAAGGFYLACTLANSLYFSYQMSRVTDAEDKIIGPADLAEQRAELKAYSAALEARVIPGPEWRLGLPPILTLNIPKEPTTMTALVKAR